ncbi:hypothetical protein CDL15_Pgr006533 [Punica granatum]|uniref:Uncharacterized protein n=1 Tax=Punica granatum TaxID=22663 RepID=A0A218Y0Y5_PUNGR|nr:hypothetical protein CDL15_Pgr006533 [Punica granatum]
MLLTNQKQHNSLGPLLDSPRHQHLHVTRKLEKDAEKKESLELQNQERIGPCDEPRQSKARSFIQRTVGDWQQVPESMENGKGQSERASERVMGERNMGDWFGDVAITANQGSLALPYDAGDLESGVVVAVRGQQIFQI